MRPIHAPEPDRPMTKKERGRFAGVLCAIALVALAAGPAACEFQPQPPESEQHGRATHATDAPADAKTSNDVFLRQRKVIQEMAADYGIGIRVSWLPCNEENSYYYGGEDPHIELCTEMSAHPGAAIMFAAHEAGHAVTDALADITDEGAADEVAMLAMVKHGYLQEMLDGATYYLEDTDLPFDHMKGDPHPGNGYRAWEFSCVESAVDGGPPECVQLYEALKLKWGLRLVAPKSRAKIMDFDATVLIPGWFSPRIVK